MGSIKLGSALAVVSQFLGASKTGGGSPKMQAASLLKESPLEMKTGSPTAHLVKNPLEFTSIQFPRDLSTGGGHFIIFYSISNTKSLAIDTMFNENIGVSIKQDTSKSSQAGKSNVGGKYNMRKLKQSRNGGEVVIGKPPPNSVQGSALATHTKVTGGVSLFMPPGIKASYSADTGHSELGKAGMAVGIASRTMGAKDSTTAIEQALKGFGGFGLSIAKDMAVGLGESIGLGDITGALSKVTATAQNNFSESVFKKINERSFSYAFKLIARNKEEAQDINKIIKFFKFHMHPELDMANGGRYFRVPSEFEIHYAYNDQKNNYLHELSRCVCNSVDVDYGGGDFQSFRQFDDEGAAPVEITLTLSFTETTLLTKQEIVDNY